MHQGSTLAVPLPQTPSPQLLAADEGEHAPDRQGLLHARMAVLAHAVQGPRLGDETPLDAILFEHRRDPFDSIGFSPAAGPDHRPAGTDEAARGRDGGPNVLLGDVAEQST